LGVIGDHIHPDIGREEGPWVFLTEFNAIKKRQNEDVT